MASVGLFKLPQRIEQHLASEVDVTVNSAVQLAQFLVSFLDLFSNAHFCEQNLVSIVLENRISVLQWTQLRITELYLLYVLDFLSHSLQHMMHHDRPEENLILPKTVEELDRRFRYLGVNVLAQ